MRGLHDGEQMYYRHPSYHENDHYGGGGQYHQQSHDRQYSVTPNEHTSSEDTSAPAQSAQNKHIVTENIDQPTAQFEVCKNTENISVGFVGKQRDFAHNKENIFARNNQHQAFNFACAYKDLFVIC